MSGGTGGVMATLKPPTWIGPRMYSSIIQSITGCTAVLATLSVLFTKSPILE